MIQIPTDLLMTNSRIVCQCVDIDECANGDSCGPGAVCRNIEGAYECSCPPGFEGDPRVGCHDHDECARASCGRGALCENLPGAYRCLCPLGFKGDPDVQCEGKFFLMR